MLSLDPAFRISASQALEEKFFGESDEMPECRPDQIKVNRHTSCHELDVKRRREAAREAAREAVRQKAQQMPRRNSPAARRTPGGGYAAAAGNHPRSEGRRGEPAASSSSSAAAGLGGPKPAAAPGAAEQQGQQFAAAAPSGWQAKPWPRGFPGASAAVEQAPPRGEQHHLLRQAPHFHGGRATGGEQEPEPSTPPTSRGAVRRRAEDAGSENARRPLHSRDPREDPRGRPAKRPRGGGGAPPPRDNGHNTDHRSGA